MSDFVHLHVHSEYSIANSTIRIDGLIKKAKALNFNALALTDHVNLFATVKFYQKAIANQIKPIIGIDIEIIEEQQSTQVILLCQNYQGYQNLCELLSQAYAQKSPKLNLPCINLDLLNQYNQNLLCIIVGPCSQMSKDLGHHHVSSLTRFWQSFLEIFSDRLYLGIRRAKPADQRFNQMLFQVMIQENISFPVVAINDVYFLNKEEHSVHLARVCIQEGIKLSDQKENKYFEDQHLKSSNEMLDLFSDLPACIKNTTEIAKRCNLILEFDQIFLPKLEISNETVNQKINREVLEALSIYLKKHPECDSIEYQKRAEYEIDIIQKTGYTGYFLIVADFVSWAKSQNIPVGPGRGSGAGSLVAYMLKITDIDPVKYGLLFERFLNISRVSMPDFDIDFCPKRRDEVIDYVMEKYGADRVAQIITFGTMTAKAVIRDSGRVLGLSYGFVDEIASLIPFDLNITIDKAMAQEALLKKRYEIDESVRTLIDLSKQLEGLKRNIGKHAGGVVISPEKMTNFLPLYSEGQNERHMTQLDKDDLEAIGLVKFDFLGLKNLTIIQDVLNDLNTQGQRIDLENIPLNDPQTFKLICLGKTQGIFQLESRGMRDIISKLQPDRFEEIVDLCALYRPGPIESGMVDSYIKYKHSQKSLDLHPKITSILEGTNGVILYQEQVMRIAQVLSGYSLSQADILRRIMGKKKPEEMQEQKSIFISGAEKNGITSKQAEVIFDHIEKFSGYGFNKSHSAAYGLIAYQTAYLKANFTADFMSVVMSYSMEKSDRLIILIQECRSIGIEVIPISVQKSFYRFTALDLKTIAYGLGAVKGLGKPVCDAIEKARSQALFKDLEDFCLRVPLPDFGIRHLMILIESGALDVFKIERNTMIYHAQMILSFSKQHHQDFRNSQSNLWGEQVISKLHFHPFDDDKKLNSFELLIREYKLLGQFLSKHPLSMIANQIGKFNGITFSDTQAKQKTQLLAWLRKKMERTGRNNQTLNHLFFEDLLGYKQEFLLDSKHWQVDFPKAHAPFVLSVQKNTYQKLSIQKIQTIDQWRNHQKGIIEIITNQVDSKALKIILKNHPGQSMVLIFYQTKKAQVKILLGSKVNINDELIRQMNALFGEHSIHINYQN